MKWQIEGRVQWYRIKDTYNGNEGRGIEGGVCGDDNVGGNSGVNMARRVEVERLVEVEVRSIEER